MPFVAKRRWFRFDLRTMFVALTAAGILVAIVISFVRHVNRAIERQHLLAGQTYVYLVLPFDRPRPETDEFKRLGVTFGGPLEGDLNAEQARILLRIRSAFPEAEVRVMHDLRGPWVE